MPILHSREARQKKKKENKGSKKKRKGGKKGKGVLTFSAKAPRKRGGRGIPAPGLGCSCPPQKKEI